MSNIFQKAPPTYQYLIGLSNIVDYNIIQVTRTAPVTNGLLQSTVIPFGTWQQLAQVVTIKANGSATAHGASSITLTVQLGGTSIMIGTITAVGSTTGWNVVIELIRINATTLIILASMGFDFSVTTAMSTSNEVRCINTLVPNFTVDNTVQFLCTDAAGAENIIQDFTVITVQ